MEDVIRLATRKCWLLGISIILSVACTTLFAATQGEIGRSSSTGSVSITLHIPEYTRLIARPTIQTDLNDAQFCLHMIDSSARTALNYYRIARLNDSSFSQDEQVLTASIKQAQVMKLRNVYGDDENASAVCEQQKISISQSNQDSNQPVLLMLIAE